jgi:hypothetical protein
LTVCITLLTTHQQDTAPAIHESPTDSIAPIEENLQHKDSISQPKPAPATEPKPSVPKKDERTRFMEDVEHMIDKAYHSTIATFCDSIFPPPVNYPGNPWADSSTEFHNQIIQIGDKLTKKYPNIPETTIRQEVEGRFQSLVTYVFNQMRANGKN